MRKVIVAVAIMAVLGLGASQAYASCGTPTALGHTQDSYFLCADNGPVAAYAYQLGAADITNTGLIKIVCTAFDGANCFGASGAAGDGKVTIESDWSIPGINNCPVDGAGGHRIILAVQCADGQGLLASIGGSDAGFAYTVELVHPFDGSNIAPIAAGNRTGRPKIVGSVAASAGSATVNLHFETDPLLYSDCDAGSLGQFFGLCIDGFTPTVTLGAIRTSIQRCGTNPDPTLTRWTATSVTPNATGDAVITVALPTDPTMCLFIGGAANISGSTSPGITGFVQLQGGLAASPKAENVKASMANGKVTVTWSTPNEIGLAALKVMASSKSKDLFELATIQPKGNGGSGFYSSVLSMGDLKGARTIIIRSVLTDGTTLDAAPVNF